MPPLEPSAANVPDNDFSKTSVTKDDHDAIDSGLDEALKNDDGSQGDEGGKGTPPAAKPAAAPTTTPAKAPVKAEPSPTKKETPPAKPAAAPAAPAAKEPPAEPPAKPPADFDKEIDSIQKPRGLSPQNDGNFEALRGVAKKYKTQYEDAVKAAAEMEGKVGKIDPVVQKEIDDLRMFRRMHDIQSDPQFVEQFDGKVKSNSDEIYSLLEQYGLEKETLEEFKKQGGITSVPMRWWYETTTVDKEGKEVKQPGWLSVLQNSTNPKANAAAVVIENKLKQNAQLDFDKNDAIKKASDSKSQYQTQKEKEAHAEKQQNEAYVNQRLSELQKDIPWAKEQPIPEDASPEERERIEAENQFFKETEKRFRIALNPSNIQQRVETAFASCLSFKLIDELEVERAKVAQLAEELGKIKAARGAPRNHGAPTIPPKPTLTKQLGQRDAEAIEDGLAAAEAEGR